MSRYSQSERSNLSFVTIILLGVIAWTNLSLILNIIYITLAILGYLIISRLSWGFITKHHCPKLQNFDNMSGVDFEYYVANLLREAEFHNISLTEKFDLGVDIIAEKDGFRWGIQVKRHSNMVKANAVRQVVTGLKLYNCDRSMVVTNSVYSMVAQRLAYGNNCLLIDRTNLNRISQLTKN